MEILFQAIIPILLGIVLWFIPIKYGIKWAKIKNVSTLWMLFGIHPFMGWIAYLVLRFGIEPRKNCNRCKESIKLEAQICRYCGNEMSQEEIALAKQEYEERKNK